MALPLTLVSYTDSAFTNAHDLVSPDPVEDGRGTFSHVGVRMQGLESQRHLNFRVDDRKEEGTFFTRDRKIVNRVEIVVGKVGDATTPNRAIVTGLELDTAFFTRNNVSTIYKITFIDELTSACSVVVSGMKLKGDTSHHVDLDNVPVTRIIITMAEGGLTRFKLFGTAAPEQLPAKESLLVGATVFGNPDASYGLPSMVLRESREGRVMAGWETCRHSFRQRLGFALPQETSRAPTKIEIDTYMHCLNPFKAVTILTCNQPGASVDALEASVPAWKVVVKDAGGVEHTEIVADSNIEAYLGDLDDKDAEFRYTLDVANSSTWKVLLPTKSLTRDTLHEFSLIGYVSF
eukprot:TRINITY_DN271_c0_g2_i1.p1 TRINITY_DN271_c0_g2~~TRINITY_DN271_c0_g2_i1.p1  ORF type:complete len:348 (-),score=49.32 TRINITY_DN271_c0_g2_i1:191-1234(-)